MNRTVRVWFAPRRNVITWASAVYSLFRLSLVLRLRQYATRLRTNRSTIEISSIELMHREGIDPFITQDRYVIYGAPVPHSNQVEFHSDWREELRANVRKIFTSSIYLLLIFIIHYARISRKFANWRYTITSMICNE